DFDSAAFNAITTAKFPLIRSLLNRITSPVVFFDIDIAFVGDPSWDPARAGMPPGTAGRNTP
ncbi:MAG: hypothetical protein VX647_00645, partial [Pseudomonadota bacterium]|nr:hypothetical protein [Pseudomonadota bacterium]